MDPVQLFGQAWPVVQALMGKAVTVVYDWTVSAMPADYQPYAPAMMPGLVAVAFGMGLSVLGKMLGSGSKKVPARTKTTKTTTDPDKYAPKLGTPWHCWFWPMFGETWVVPLAPGWWPRWKWLEAEVKVFAWTVNVSYQANWFIHTVLFKIPGLGWRLVLAVVAHIGIVGGTGQGKDAILQWVIEHVHGRSVVTVCLDLSAPSELSMRRAGGLIIKPNGKVRWNLLAGDPRFMAERVSRFWRMGDNDTGSTRGAFRKIAEAYGRAVPSHQRHIGGPAEEGGQGLYAWCETHKFEGQGHWLNRLYDLHLALGTTDGPNGIDVTELIAKKKKFGFFFDTFRMVAATGPLGIAVILDLMRASADVGDLREGETGALPEDVALEFENVKGLRGAYVILNEGGSLEGRTQELDLFLKAARARDCRVWAAVQNPQHFGGVLTANIFQWIMFATGESKVRKWQSETLDGREPPEAFSAGGGGIRPLECFVQAAGRLQKVRIQPPDMRKPRKMPVAPTVNAANCSGEPVRWPGVVVMVDEVGTGRGYGMAHARQPRLREVPIGSRMLKGPDQVRSYVRGKADRERVFGKLQGTWNRRGCHAWGAKSRNRAYGKTSYLGRSGWSPHFLMWAWRLMVDETDLRRFCEAHPQVQAFEWPQAAELVDRGALVEYERRHGLRLSLRPNVWPVEAELIRLLALQAWMRRWDLHLDHRCPGAPNPLCANAGEAGEAIELAHVWLTTREENLELRWLRERGEVREGVPDVLEAQGVA